MIITLTTDFGIKDHYVGALKGMIYSKLPDIKIVDISHEVPPFAIQEALYIVESSYHFFPEKSIHIILVDAEVSLLKKPLIVLWNNHYFLSSDSGLLSLLTSEKKPELIIAASFDEYENSTEIFVRLASEIKRGKSVFELGEPVEFLKEEYRLKPIVSDDNRRITGSIIYVDRYGNAISNISRSLFEKTREKRDFEILFRNYKVTKIHNNYIEYETEKAATLGGRLSVFNPSDLLEIALYRGNQRSGGTASTLFGLEYESQVTIQFK